MSGAEDQLCNQISLPGDEEEACSVAVIHVKIGEPCGSKADCFCLFLPVPHWARWIRQWWFYQSLISTACGHMTLPTMGLNFWWQKGTVSHKFLSVLMYVRTVRRVVLRGELVGCFSWSCQPICLNHNPRRPAGAASAGGCMADPYVCKVRKINHFLIFSGQVCL